MKHSFWPLLPIMLLLGGCTAKVQNFSERTEVPGISAEYFHAGDGAELPLKRWQAKHSKAVIVAVHGFNDYSHAFKMPGEHLSERGISLYAYDQRGFGKSAETGIWAGQNNLIHDLTDFVEAVKAAHPKAPLYVMGESMGGAVVIAASAEGLLEKADDIILVAPAVWGGKAMNPFYRGTLWIMTRLFPYAKFTGKSVGKQASDNIEMLKELGKDPLFIKETRVDAISGIVSLMGEALEKSPNIKNRALLLYGSKDQIIPAKPVKKFVEGMGDSHQVIWYENGWHMLLRDLQREAVYEDIIKWVGGSKPKMASSPQGKQLKSLLPSALR